MMYIPVFHKTLTPEKWAVNSRTRQVLMIANELNRAGNFLSSGFHEEVGKCYERAMELTDLTVEDLKWKPHLKELLRFREVLGELYLSKDQIKNQMAMSLLIRFDAQAFNMLH